MTRSPLARSAPFAALAALAAGLVAAPAHAQPQVEPGEWEQTMTLSESDAPGHGGMRQSIRTCITSEDAAILGDRERWAQEMAKGASPEAKCELRSSKQNGSAVSVVLACANDVVVTVRHDFRGRTGTIETETRAGGQLQGANRIESRKVADTCSPATIERWKQLNPGRTFNP